ncbi:restriction endonuclease subunit S, partial [Lactobacillus crispatus]|uniref:restriction endonuclease subunit S n=1 Tax=Lactobacillus crispatus TaxID=47770 RepID=UPI00166B469F
MIQKSIGILADQIRGVSYKKKNLHDTLDENSVILLRANNIINGKLDFTDVLYVDKSVISDTQYLKYGDILISASSGSKKVIGKAASFHSQCKCTFGAFCKVIRPHKDVREFLRIYFQSSAYRRQISHLALGANINNIRNEHIDSLQLEIPNETARKQIVNKIDLLQKILTKKQQILSDLDELIKARFVEMFGDPINNSKNWKLINIKKCCVDILGGGTPSKSHPEFFTGSVPWVTPKDMKENVITDSKDHITYEAISNSSAKLIPSNSVLMVIRSGILKHTLPVAINKNEVTINQDMKAFVPTSEISPIFLENYFIAISPDILSKVRSVTADNINFKSFQKRKIIL